MNRPPPRIGRPSSVTKCALRVAYYFLLVTGGFALSYTGYVVAESRAYQDLEARKFLQASRLSEPHVLVEGDVIGEIEVPRVGIRAIVLHGDSPDQLRHAVGHLPKSALPGESGNVVLAGHRDTFFRPLQNVRVGDKIRFITRERGFEYRVESIETVEPTDIRVLQASTGHDMTLLTCFPFHYIGSAPKRFVVHAREVDEIALHPSVQPAPRIEDGVLK